jgi:hypothetical protein
VSCSPYRVPVARLAAAQASVAGEQSASKAAVKRNGKATVAKRPVKVVTKRR